MIIKQYKVPMFVDLSLYPFRNIAILVYKRRNEPLWRFIDHLKIFQLGKNDANLFKPELVNIENMFKKNMRNY
jgi:hypothetical protein